MKSKFLFFSLIILLLAFSCSKADDNNNTDENGYASLNNIAGDQGSRIIVTQNNEDLIFSGANVLGWGSTSLLNQNYAKDLRLLHDGFETLEIRMSIPGNLDFVETAVNSQGLNGSTLLLENTQNLNSVIVEMYYIENLERQQYFGTLEIRRNVENLGAVYDMVGTFEINRNGQIIKGLFWKEEVANW